ncbi:MAG TPA: hypothetical protein VK711_15560 [Puia sp.]|jgi:hypothetical protein|nr:hypothetical protein [Puia sp.]
MHPLTDETVKRPCAFIIRINRPLHTQVEIGKFLINRSISVSTMHLQFIREQEAILIIHCMIERDRTRRTAALLEKIKGIIGLELLESKATNLMKNVL